MKLILKVTLIILLLPAVALVGFYIAGNVMTGYLQVKQDVVRAQQDEISGSGNGFGGDVGMVVVDSGYHSKRFGWLDNDHLFFSTEWMANSDKNEARLYVWNVVSNEVKPVDIYGRLFCARGKDVYFYDGNREKENPEDQYRFSNVMRGNLVEDGSVWRFENVELLTDVWSSPGERYEFAWASGCLPKFRVKPEIRSDGDLEKYRTKLMPEWGWVMRFPDFGPGNYEQSAPEMGFFKVGAEPYFEQAGEKLAGLADWTINEMIRSELRYVEFLDRYWMAIVNSDFKRKEMTGFITRDGRFREREWSAKWPQYSDMPLPTRKGMVWSGSDFRVQGPGYYDAAYFIEDKLGGIHTVIKGDGHGNRMSKDGCRIAFYNAPRQLLGATTLKIFDACRSTVNEKEFEDVEY